MAFDITDAAALSHRVPTRSLYLQDPTADQLFPALPWHGISQQELSVAAVQVAAQVEFNRQILLRTLGDAVINGTDAADSFVGMQAVAPTTPVLIDASQRLAVVSALTFPDLDNLIAMITEHGGRPDYLVGNARFHKTYSRLYTTPTAKNAPPSVVDSRSGRRLPSYAGVPILRCDYITTDMADQTSVFAFCVGKGVGLSLIHPEGVGERGYEVRHWYDDKDSQLNIASSWTCSLALYRRTAIAALDQVTVVA